MRQRDPRPRILGAVDVGRQVATVDRPHRCTPATVGHGSRVNPGVAAMARVCPRSVPDRATSPAEGDDRAAGRRLPSRCVETRCEGARVAALPKSPGEPGDGLDPPGACPSTGRHIELRVAGHLSERARGAFGDDRVVCADAETVIRGVLPDPSHVHEFLARCRSLGLQVISLRRDPAMRLSRSGGSDERFRAARGGNHGSDR